MVVPDLLQEGLVLFNRGQYYEAHEVWEDLWRATDGPLRLSYQGLVQSAVGLHHRSRANRLGAEALLHRAIRNLEKDPTVETRIDIPDLVRQLQEILDGMPQTSQIPQILLLP
jgi:uncharacterized protein